jgi:hypothetical protein
MSDKRDFLRRCFRAGFLLGTILAGTQPSCGAVAAYWLNGITYSNTSPPSSSTATGSGLITWTYAPGDFLNGTGQFVYLNLPPSTIPPYYPTLFDVASTQITGQLVNANVDCYWYDWAITFAPALSSPNSSAQITGGNYDLTIGSCQNVLGQVVGGTLTPYRPTLSVQRSGTKVLLSWPTNYADGFILECADSLGRNAHWTTSSVPVTVLGQSYFATNGIAGDGNLFFRLTR